MRRSLSLTKPVVDLKPQRKKRTSLAEIDPEVVDQLLNVYATDLTYNLYDAAEYLNISNRSLYTLLKKDPFKSLYEAAQAKRAELTHIAAYQALSETYVATTNGTVGDGQVAAAKNLANYLARYGENLTLGPANARGDRSPKVSISIKLPDFNQVVGSVKVSEDEDNTVEYEEC